MPKRNLIWIVGLVILAGCLWWVHGRTLADAAIPRSLEPVVNAFGLIHEKYYGDLDDRRLARGAIKGLVSSLDEFSSYVSPEQLETFRWRMKGHCRGLGLVLEIDDGAVVVVGPAMNSPAHQAGIFGGQRLLAVDKEPVAGRTLSRIEGLLVGPAGTKVHLTLAAPTGERREVILTRAEYPVQTVLGLYRRPSGQWEHAVPEVPDLAYVRIPEFVKDTGGECQRVVRSLPETTALILDLRDNPGGLLPSAVATANLFLSGGPIVTVAGRAGPTEQHVAHTRGTSDVPVVVLVDARTASAAEIVAGAMGFHGRAVLIGTRTRGKGCVQTMYDLDDNMGRINLTTSQFLVGGAWGITRRPGSDDWGVDPDVEVVISRPARRELVRLRRRAAVVPAPRKRTMPATGDPDGAIGRQRVKLDPQLARAVALARDIEKLRSMLTEIRRKRSTTRPSAVAPETHE